MIAAGLHPPILVGKLSSDLWPAVLMSDGTYRMGPFAEVVGRGPLNLRASRNSGISGIVRNNTGEQGYKHGKTA